MNAFITALEDERGNEISNIFRILDVRFCEHAFCADELGVPFNTLLAVIV